MMKSLRVLVVEDEAIIAYLLAEVLKGMGHEVCAIEGSQEGAIASAERCKPDLMIVDEHLGEGSGLAVVEAVLRGCPTRHIFVSGDTFKIKQLMPDAVVMEKPYYETDLARAIHSAMALPAAPPGGEIERPAKSENSKTIGSGNQDGSAFEPPRAQIGESSIGLIKRVCLRDRGDTDLGRQFEEVDPILAGEIGDRDKPALFPQQLIGKTGNIAHMDAGADHDAAFANCP
jgi:CheY-like chemotaxis protein